MYGGRDLNWRKPKRSMNGGNCVEAASIAGIVVIRDSKDQRGFVLRYPATTWRSFVGAAKAGDLDLR